MLLALVPALFALPASATPPVAAGPPPGAAAAPVGIDYENRAKSFLRDHGFDDESSDVPDLDTVLDGGMFAKVRIGAFDLRFPTSELRDKDRAVAFEEISMALVDLQEHWVEWTVEDEELRDQLTSDFKELRKWVKSWSPRSLAMVEASDEKDLLLNFGAKDSAREAIERLNPLMASGEFMGLRGKTMDTTARIIFAPDRHAFINWACFAGLIETRMRPRFWHEAIGQWTKIWSGNTQIVCMEYPSWPFDARYPDRGETMNSREKTGVQEHAVEAAASSLFWQWYGPTDAFFFESALATVLTIDQCGRNNVRIGGVTTKSSGNSTQPYERFVPGGNPAGGQLPARSATEGNIEYVPLWRETKGSDYFVDALTKSQKQGGKMASKEKGKTDDERDHFMLEEAEKGARAVVSAPFFGKYSVDKDLPPIKFLDIYEDFFRAYKACFVYWLREEAGGRRGSESRAKFGELLRMLATRDPDATSFAECVEAVYGVPLSERNGETDTVEWRFLTWIEKQ